MFHSLILSEKTGSGRTWRWVQQTVGASIPTDFAPWRNTPRVSCSKSLRIGCPQKTPIAVSGVTLLECSERLFRTRTSFGLRIGTGWKHVRPKRSSNCDSSTSPRLGESVGQCSHLSELQGRYEPDCDRGDSEHSSHSRAGPALSGSEESCLPRLFVLIQ